MSLFESLEKLPPTYQQLKALQASNIKFNLVSDAQAILSTLEQRYKMSLDRVWNNKYLTPQEVVDQLGNDAIQIFQGSALLQQFLVQQYYLAGVKDYIPPVHPSWAVITPNADGTITISGTPS